MSLGLFTFFSGLFHPLEQLGFVRARTKRLFGRAIAVVLLVTGVSFGAFRRACSFVIHMTLLGFEAAYPSFDASKQAKAI